MHFKKKNEKKPKESKCIKIEKQDAQHKLSVIYVSFAGLGLKTTIIKKDSNLYLPCSSVSISIVFEACFSDAFVTIVIDTAERAGRTDPSMNLPSLPSNWAIAPGQFSKK